MSPLNVHLSDLIVQLDGDFGAATDLDKITEAQRRAYTLNDLGDQLVGHYVDQARAAGASWTQIGDAIGVSKQAAQQRWVPINFARFTQRGRNVVVLAHDSARTRGEDQVGTEHLLFGLLGEPEGVAGKVLIELAGSVDTIANAIPAPAEGKRKNQRGHLAFTEQAKQALSHGSQESLALLHNYVGTEHILLGLLAVPDGQAARTLTELGIGADVVRPKVLHALGGFTKTD